MAAIREFESILDHLDADKVKERTAAISRFYDFVASKRNVAAVTNSRHSWLHTIQLLFSIVIKERNAYVAKPAPAVEKRLDDAANLVRVVVEKVHRVVSRKTAKAIVAHLTQTSAVQGKLQPYALTYMKALRTVLAYPPHVEHLDERQWTDIVSLCFSAVLGDKIKIGQDFVDDAAMDIDDDDNDGDGAQVGGGALRAGLDEETARPSTTRSKANPTEIELVGVIEVVFRSKSSPFLVYAQAIFRKFLRLLRRFPAETTAHYSALVALNRVFAEVDLNDQRSMRRIGPHLWHHVVALWPTKSATLKEQVVIALRYLFPFVVPPPLRSSTGGGASANGAGLNGDLAAIARAKELYEAVLAETSIRWRDAYALDLDALRLGLDSSSSGGGGGGTRAYDAQTFRLGTGFDDKHAVAWGVVELGADALARIYEVEDAVGAQGAVEEMMSPTKRGKRRKVEDPLSVLLDSLSDPTVSASAVILRLQIILFLVDRHWAALDPEACQRIYAALMHLLPHSDANVERWAFVAVAAVAHAGLPLEHIPGTTPPARRKRDKAPSSSPWDPLWLLVQRKLSTPEVCRPAAHVGNVLLAHDRVGPASLADSIEAFARDVDVQGGASFPSDAVCLFYEWTLAIAASDARLVRLHLADKVLAWLTSSWSALDGVARAHSFGHSRPHADPLSVAGLVSLVARLSGITSVPHVAHDSVVPDCAIASMALELGETARIRDYLEARVPAYDRGGGSERGAAVSHSSWRSPSSYDAGGGAPADLEQSTPRKVGGWLVRTLKGLLDGAGESSWTSMDVGQVRRCLDLAALAFVVEGVYTMHRIPSTRSALGPARDLLTNLAPTLTLNKWLPAERAFLVGALSPILVAFPHRPAVEYPVLLDPGIASGVPRHLLPVRKRDSTALDLDSPEMELLRSIWKNDDARRALDEVLAALRFLLSADAGGSPSESVETPAATFALTQAPAATQVSQRIRELEQTQRADDFGESRSGGGGGSSGRLITDRQRYLGDDDLIRRVFLQIVDAVEYCHANGIYHRDLKPENILCVDDGEKVMLADFGLATGERMSGDFGCGSTFYMSPECQGGLFQRLSSYSTPHNDIWSLGVILVNLRCGRNPWKQACPSDETFCAYLGNPDFLRSILPISEPTNRILKRIFALNPQARISLADLRREILSVDTFVMSENELRHATRATKEAARAFAASAAVKGSREVEGAVEGEVVHAQHRVDEARYDEVMAEGPEEVSESSAQSTPWQKAEGFSSPATPTQPARKTPLTPPATPRRVPRAPPTPIHPAPHSPTPRRKRVEAPSTPPPQARATFEAYRSTSADGEDLVATPPSPITPSSRRRTSPRRSPRTAARQLPSSRRRKTSIDSSSSSSGNSSQPATPTGLPPHSYAGASATAPYANKVRIAGEDEPVPVPALTELSLDQPCTSTSSTSSTLSADTKAAYTAYYPIWSDDWADACRDQQASYHVELPPPVVLPAEMDAHDEETADYQFPLPPSSGYYTRIPARATDEQLVH